MSSETSQTPILNNSSPPGLNEAIELEEIDVGVRPFSTETQRRNGVRHSKNPDKGAAIMEDIGNHVYDCVICYDTILPDTAMWDCRGCFQVFHYACIRQWATSRLGFRLLPWACPACKHESTQIPREVCWCRTLTFPNAVMTSTHNLPPNSCVGRCGRRANKCFYTHNHTCGKRCHAGPCEKCPRCAIEKTAADRNLKAAANASSGGPQSRTHVSAGIMPNSAEEYGYIISDYIFGFLGFIIMCISTLILLIITLFPLIVINVGFIIWVVLLTRRVTQPYNYPDWIFKDDWFHNQACMVALLTTFSMANGLLTITYMTTGYRSSYIRTTDTFKRTAYVMFSVFIVPVAFFWPVTAFVRAPANVWYNTMRHTCNGFDTRVSLDSRGKNDKLSPNTTIFLHTPGSPPTLPPLYIGSHIQYTSDPLEPYQYFFRISGSTSRTANLAVDFDFENRVWRMLHMNQTDLTNSWSARNYTKLRDSPVYHDHQQTSIATATLIKNGTWIPSKNLTHHTLHLPSLSLQIPHFYEFTQSCAYEPFLKIHRTTSLPPSQIPTQITNRKWNKYSESTVVMRTANFGHAQRVTDVCVREDDWKQGGLWHEGLGDDLLVPLGLVQALRLKWWGDATVDGGRGFCFGEYRPWKAGKGVGV